MPRISSASVRLVQKMNRVNRNGENPVYVVVCFGGRVEKATGVSCLPKFWDSRREVIKGGCPNAPVLNRMLLDIKSRVLERKNNFEFAGKRYTPQMLLEESVDSLRAGDADYWVVCERIIAERRLRDGTIRRYSYTYRKLQEYLGRRSFVVDELVLSVVKGFASWLEKGGIKINTIKSILCCVAAVWNYAISKRIVDASGYPFTDFRYTSVYKEIHRDYFLEEEHLVRLKEYWLSLVCERDGKRWHYRDGAYERLRQRWTREWGILWFLLCYKYGGAAPIDVALLRPTDFSRESIDGVEYWKLMFRRKKTDRGVTYMIKRDMFSIISLEHFLGDSGRYVYPILYYRDGCADRYLLEQSHKAAGKAMKWVREAFLEINADIAKENAEGGEKKPLVDVTRLVMYSARHSRASNYFNSPGATIGQLASMLGRSANTISTYAHFLQESKDVAKLDDGCVI